MMAVGPQCQQRGAGGRVLQQPSLRFYSGLLMRSVGFSLPENSPGLVGGGVGTLCLHDAGFLREKKRGLV